MPQGWQLRNIYLYLVCFVTLLIIVFGLVTFLNHAVNYFFPVSYHHYPTLMEIEEELFRNNEEVPSVDKLEQIRDERVAQVESRDNTRKLRTLVSSLAVWIIPIPFYLYHWRKIKRELFPDKE